MRMESCCVENNDGIEKLIKRVARKGAKKVKK